MSFDEHWVVEGEMVIVWVPFCVLFWLCGRIGDLAEMARTGYNKASTPPSPILGNPLKSCRGSIYHPIGKYVSSRHYPQDLN